MHHTTIALYADSQREWAALLIDGRLVDLHSHNRARYDGPVRGEICAATVTRTVAGGRAAFVDIGGGRAGFLGEASDLDPGDQILVQVDRYAFEGKAARVRENVWVTGDLSVVIRDGDGVAVSRRIANPEIQDRFSHLLDSLADDMRVIVRTAAQGAPEEDLYQEVLTLRGRLERMEEQARRGSPRTLEGALGPVQRGLDEWMVDDHCEVLAAGSRVEEAVGSASDARIGFLREEGDLLRRDDLDHQIRLLTQPRIDLSGGGWISIEPTKALVAVDVNTGNSEMSGRLPVETSVQAAREIPRQLRLRGLGGIVVVDFPSSSERDADRIEEELKRSLASESNPSGRAYGWTELGLYEITRRRDRRPLAECFGY